MMCLFGQLHIREKSILTYVFLKGAMSSVKSCGLVYFVKYKLHVLFAIELKKLLVNDKITASCPTNMSRKHYLKCYTHQT